MKMDAAYIPPGRHPTEYGYILIIYNGCIDAHTPKPSRYACRHVGYPDIPTFFPFHLPPLPLPFPSLPTALDLRPKRGWWLLASPSLPVRVFRGSLRTCHPTAPIRDVNPVWWTAASPLHKPKRATALSSGGLTLFYNCTAPLRPHAPPLPRDAPLRPRTGFPQLLNCSTAQLVCFRTLLTWVPTSCNCPPLLSPLSKA
jgi:hypothetical protein